ncbi:MAG: cytochrome c maturation protein CcmE [Rhodospirillales bacterium]|nr:cytochrome c maturation protein CcmE [Rhodospirillales bacterium]
MTRKRRRLYFLGLFMLGLGTATALALVAFQDNLVFFYSPSDIVTKQPAPERSLRIGGLVEEGSVERGGAAAGKRVEVRFRVTDLQHTVPVVFSGILPDLFREGQGVVALGKLGPDGVFRASEVLAKHDENYMPPEVAEALKRSGRWNETGGQRK